MFDTLYTLVKKLEAGQLVHTHWYAPAQMFIERSTGTTLHRQEGVAALEEEGVALADPTSGEDSKSEVEAVDGLNVCLSQVMSSY